MKPSKKMLLIGGLLGILVPVLVWASNLTVPNNFTTGSTVSSSAMNTNFAAVATAVNSKQDAITQNCGAGSAITAIGTNGTTGTATCSPVQAATTQSCLTGQALSAIDPTGSTTCAGPVVQACMVPMPRSYTTAGSTTIFPAAAGNPATSCGQTFVTTGALPQNCMVTVNCRLDSAGIPAGGGVFLDVEEQVGGGVVDCINTCGTGGNTCCNGWFQPFGATQGGSTSASVTQQTVCPANTICKFGAYLSGTQSSGTTYAAFCQVSYLCIAI